MTQENWTFFFGFDSRELNCFYDSKLNLFIVLNMIQRIELLWVLLKVFHKWLKEFFLMTDTFEPFFLNMTQKNWTFFFFGHMYKYWFFSVWFTKLNLLYMTQRTWIFFKYDSKIWTFFSLWLKEWNLLFSWTWRKELNLFFFTITNRIELFLKIWFKKNCIFFLNGPEDMNPLLNMFQWIEPSFLHTQRNNLLLT